MQVRKVGAIYFHTLSSDERLFYEFCNVAWCCYKQRERAGTLHDYRHTGNLPQRAVETIRSVIKDLAKTELLNKCEGYTQNANELLNTAKWTYPPKAHKRLKTVNTTAALAL